MESLHARHSPSCPRHGRGASRRSRARSTDAPAPHGPKYYSIVHERGGKTHRTKVGKSRRVALRALSKVPVEEDEGEGSLRPQLNIRFEDFGREWREAPDR